MKKLFALVAVALTLCGLLTACGSQPTPPAAGAGCSCAFNRRQP